MKRIPLSRLPLVLLASFSFILSAHAATLTVNTTFDELDTPSGASVSLREAVRDAAPGDTIDFAPALSGQTLTLTTGAEIVLSKSVTIDASSLAAGIIIDGGAGTNRIFSVSPGQSVSLIGLTLTGGNGVGASLSGFGGAILNFGTLSLTRCTLSGNSANNGGGVHNVGTATVDACTFIGNAVTVAGGGFSSGSSATLTRSTFSGNTATNNGGGAVNATLASTSLALENCTIVGNSASGATATGGGVRQAGGTVTVKNCIVAGNTAGTVGTENLGGTITQTGANITTGDPLLAPLGNSGGPTQTMPPLAGSPAIDAAVGSTFTTDQRGMAITGVPDIGAVENGSRVTTGTDELDTPAGASISLREAVRDTPANGVIDFAAALSGGTCTLTAALGGEIVLSKSVTIDATSLPAGITIDGGGGTTRIFSVSPGQSVSLIGLTLTGGNGVGASNSGFGGAILNKGTLSLTRCTLSGNSASYGGGVYNSGTATVDACTFIGNTALNGGGFSSQSSATVTRSTFSGNTATNLGGGAVNGVNVTGTNVTLENCTIVGNSASGGTAIGGGVRQAGGTVTVKNCIVAGNTAGTVGTENLGGFITQTGANVTSGDPLVAPLGNYGGPTQTMPPLAGSPAIDGAVGSTFTTDQRGVSIAGLPDIGAVENGSRVTTGTDELDTPAGASISLREAVRDTPAGGAIVFDPALSGGTCTLAIALGGEIVLSKSVTIDASSLAAGIIIDGGAGTNRIFSVSPGQSVSLIGLTLTGGNGVGASNSGFGGAILNRGTLSLTHCTLSGNSASNGGGVYNSGTATVDACTFIGNIVTNAGGGFSSQSSATVTRSTFSGNTATTFGGGAVNGVNAAGTNVTLENCTIVGNSASGGTAIGGGVRQAGGTVTVKNCIVAGNTAGTVGTENLGGFITQTGANVTSGDPLVAPLGNYGGPTQTMPPLAGSPAIDGAVGSTFTTDQRGVSIAGLPDIGAVENGSRVTTGTDELDTPAGASISLRGAVRDTPAGGAIVFDPALSGGACTLTAALGGEIVLSKSVTIDATSLPAGMTVSGGGASRIFNVNSGQTVSLIGLTLTGGNGVGAISGSGGAINNQGSLTLTRCTVSGNSVTGNGAGIVSGGNLTVIACTVSGNTAGGAGGGITAGGVALVTQSTFFNNTANATGGGAVNVGTASTAFTLENCTIVGNNAPGSGETGGGVRRAGGTVTITNCIVAGNTAGSVKADNLGGTITQTGANVTSGDPLVAPLGNYGGPTQTMALKPGSPARDAAVGSTFTTDQRGFPIVGTPDIGAYEAGTTNTFDLWAIENAGSALDFGSDEEQDGAVNGLEYATRRDPLTSDTQLSPTLTPAAAGHAFQFRYRAAARDLRYIVQRSADLTLPGGGWVEIYRYDSSTGLINETGITASEDSGTQLITLIDPTVGPKLFWRLCVERVP